MNRIRKLLIIETLSSGAGFQIIEDAIDLGIPFYFISTDLERTMRLMPIKLIGKFHIYFCKNFTVENLEKVLRDEICDDIDGVVCMLDNLLNTVSKFARKNGLNFTNPEAIKIAIDKKETRVFSEKYGIRSPNFIAIEKADEPKLNFLNLNFPCIVKPEFGSGSINVKRVDNIETLVDTVRELFLFDGQECLLIEEMVFGPLLSVEGFVHDGATTILGVTDRKFGSQPYFVETGMSFPVDLGEQLNSDIEIFASNIIDKLNYSYGFFHIEICVSGSDIYLIEINPRIGGRLISSMIGIAYDINFYEEFIKLAFGDFPNFLKKPTYGSSSIFLFPKESGILAVLDFSITSKYDGIIKCILNKEINIGDVVCEPKDFRGYLILLLTKGKNSEHASAICRAIESSIVIKISQQ